MKVEHVKHNFKQHKSNKTYHYYDKENVVSLTIFLSGWSGMYQCIEEWGEYSGTEQHLYNSEEIFKIYGIKTFSRKEKLIKINESTL